MDFVSCSIEELDQMREKYGEEIYKEPHGSEERERLVAAQRCINIALVDKIKAARVAEGKPEPQPMTIGLKPVVVPIFRR